MTERLRREGYEIVARNWRVRGGEVDIIALDGDVLAFVEVRARAAGAPVHAEATVDRRKIERIALAAEAFVDRHPAHWDRVWRIDLVAVTVDAAGRVRELTHYQDLTLD